MSGGKFGGWRLAAYQWEHDTYPQFQSVRVDRHRAEVLIRKLARHFKTTCPRFSMRMRRGGGGHYTPSMLGVGTITLGKEPTLGLVCHEFAHHLETVRHNSRRWHGKQFKRELKRVYTFARRYLPQ